MASLDHAGTSKDFKPSEPESRCDFVKLNFRCLLFPCRLGELHCEYPPGCESQGLFPPAQASTSPPGKLATGSVKRWLHQNCLDSLGNPQRLP